MHVKKIDDSRVDEMIKEAEKQSLTLHTPAEAHISDDKTEHKKNTKQIMGSILIFILLALSLIQSIELINLKAQIQKGQFSSGNASAAPAGTDQGLPTQQGGC